MFNLRKDRIVKLVYWTVLDDNFRRAEHAAKNDFYLHLHTTSTFPDESQDICLVHALLGILNIVGAVSGHGSCSTVENI